MTRQAGAKVLWIIFVIILPFLGVFIYLIAKHDGMAERNIRQMKAQQAQFDDHVRAVAGGGAAAEIEKAKGLLDCGAITQAEFDAIKAEGAGFLSRARAARPSWPGRPAAPPTDGAVSWTSTRNRSSAPTRSDPQAGTAAASPSLTATTSRRRRSTRRNTAPTATNSALPRKATWNPSTRACA